MDPVRCLRQIEQHPAVVSTELAAAAGLPRDYYKIRVRRLKALGLTESLEVGYRLSPRGAAYLPGWTHTQAEDCATRSLTPETVNSCVRSGGGTRCALPCRRAGGHRRRCVR